MEKQFQWNEEFQKVIDQNGEGRMDASQRLSQHVITFDISYADCLGLLLDHHIEENDVFDCKTIWEWYQGANISATCQYLIGKAPDICLCFMSLGNVVDQKMDELQAEGHILQAYILECFSMELLRKAYGSFGKYMESKYDIGLEYFHFLDEDEMQKVPGFMKKAGVEDIVCNEALAFIPQKTVVFYCDYERLNGQKRSGDDKCGEICQYCVNSNCPNRKKKEEKADMGRCLSYGFQRIFSQYI